jgi:uncharacterized DUF497 family protein
MRYDWDETKRRANLEKHGVDFTAVHSFDWELATRRIDDRDDYGELREQAIGFIGAVPHVLIFTEREDGLGSIIWVISLRKADKKERREHGRAIEI